MIARVWLLSLLCHASLAHRTWKCDEGKCVKEDTDDLSGAVSVQKCKLTCLPYGGLWPAPTGDLQISSTLVNVNPVDVAFSNTPSLPAETAQVLNEAEKVFLTRIKGTSQPSDDTHNLLIQVHLTDADTTYYTYDVDESYALTLSSYSDGENKLVTADLTANNFIGARHGLETLAQLIIYDDLHEKHLVPSSVNITDKPAYKHRGLHWDTARSYFPPSTMRSIIDGMAQNKLNSLHWHITDTHSFPYVSNAYPVLSSSGAYSNDKVYTQQDIKDLVEYARVRGVRITPELDQPAHVGEGWVALDKDLITCFGWEPWTEYCVEPPCGQFDPTNDRVYPLLGTIYQEWAQLFKSDLFHLGGDEVNFGCWNATEKIRTWMTAQNISLDHDGFIKLWDIYQQKSLAQLRATAPKVTPLMWTSSLTENSRATEVLDPAEYIIQIWTKKDDSHIATLIRQKYRVIFSNYDELYFDCGAGAWIGGPGQNWCSPYIGWQAVYGHDPLNHIKNLGVEITEAVEELALGSEAALWTEQLDEHNVGGRYWPRGAALAERLWTRPSWEWQDAQYRMNHHRERMVRNGAQADLLQPEWCYQHDGFCGLGVRAATADSANKQT